MIPVEILIIGGGASGLIAALTASDNGAKVAIVEGGNRIAKKILTTGNGRCNITNKEIKPPYKMFHSYNASFYQTVLNQFTVLKTIDLFNYLGLPITTLDKGKMYPQSLQASSVVDILLMNLDERHIPVYLESKVTNITKQGNNFLVETTNVENPNFLASKVLIATGGCAAPNTGSDGNIYKIIKNLGHTIINPLPSIVQLKLDYKNLKAISGVRIDALASVIINNHVERIEFDEVLFTDYGISGPAILQISRHASLGLSEGKEVKVALDLFPNLKEEEIMDYFEKRFILHEDRTVYQSLIGVVHKKLISAILKDSGIKDIHQTCLNFAYNDRYRLYKTMKHWEFKCVGTNGFNNAQTTIGGVNTKEVDEKTLQSKLVEGLYFSGEVLDVDGDCGGFNLQWAWSSGVIAGQNMLLTKNR